MAIHLVLEKRRRHTCLPPRPRDDTGHKTVIFLHEMGCLKLFLLHRLMLLYFHPPSCLHLFPVSYFHRGLSCIPFCLCYYMYCTLLRHVCYNSWFQSQIRTIVYDCQYSTRAWFTKRRWHQFLTAFDMHIYDIHMYYSIC
jgi:hypothetical protein